MIFCIKAVLWFLLDNVVVRVPYRSLHGVRILNLRKLFLLKCRGTEKLSTLRVCHRIFRVWEVELCLLYHRQHCLIFMIQRQQKSGRNSPFPRYFKRKGVRETLAPERGYGKYTSNMAAKEMWWDVPVVPVKLACQPPEYENLEKTPKIFKVGTIFISGPFFLDFTFFNAITVRYLRN